MPASESSPVLVHADEADLPAIVALLNRAYRSEQGWSTESDYLQGDRTTDQLLRADLQAAPSARLLKWQTEADGLLASVWLEPRADGVWYLGSFAVDPTRQGDGLGARVLAAAEAYVAGEGGTRVRMSVINVRDTLIAWYERRGYALTGGRDPFPYGDDRFGTPLRDDLCFLTLEKNL